MTPLGPGNAAMYVFFFYILNTRGFVFSHGKNCFQGQKKTVAQL